MGPEQAPTRAAVIELKAERIVVGEAYDFLDEKRLLLAAELLKQLAHYQQLRAALEKATAQAREALATAIKSHGLQGLGLYPAATGIAALDTHTENLMGVTLLETDMPGAIQEGEEDSSASRPSVEARQCRAAFRALLPLSAKLAGVSGNLYRLFIAYRVTERRARALENVILPDIEKSLERMSTHLEETDLEDAIRARGLGRHSGPGR